MGDRSILLLDSGRAVVCLGSGEAPEPADGTSFVAVANGRHHAVFLQDDGQVVVVGFGRKAPAVPPLPESMRYTAVAAGERQIVLLRDDGNVVAMSDSGGRLSPPKLPVVCAMCRCVQDASTPCFYAMMVRRPPSARTEPDSATSQSPQQVRSSSLP